MIVGHGLFEFPRFEYTREILAAEIAQARCKESWTWDFLLCEDRPYLAKFLHSVHAATFRSLEADAVDES